MTLSFPVAIGGFVLLLMTIATVFLAVSIVMAMVITFVHTGNLDFFPSVQFEKLSNQLIF